MPAAGNERHRMADRANLASAYIAIAGIVLFNIAVYLDWAKPRDGEGLSGFETDSVVPFAAYVGIGLAVALLFAGALAYHRHHPNLALTSMAAGIGVALFSLAYGLDVPGNAERTAMESDIGPWIGLIGAVIWALGSAMLAREHADHPDHRAGARRTTDEDRIGPG